MTCIVCVQIQYIRLQSSPRAALSQHGTSSNSDVEAALLRPPAQLPRSAASLPIGTPAAAGAANGEPMRRVASAPGAAEQAAGGLRRSSSGGAARRSGFCGLLPKVQHPSTNAAGFKIDSGSSG